MCRSSILCEDGVGFCQGALEGVSFRGSFLKILVFGVGVRF